MTRTLNLALLLAFVAAPAMAQTGQTDVIGALVASPSTPLTQPAISSDASHEAIGRWLADHVPSSRGHEVFVSGTEAFWLEHQDRDASKPMHVVATLHSEYFADASATFRSAYQVTDFDCERQTQYRVYLRRYQGPDLSGDVRNENEILKISRFVGPTDQDYAHLRTVCLPVYDEIRKRTYSITVPLR